MILFHMDLGKYASGKLTIEAILDKFFMDGFLDTNEIQKIGDMLKAFQIIALIF